MRLSNGYYVFAKNDSSKLGSHFKAYEFQCPCSKCTENWISIELVDKLNTIRQALGAPLKITSGYRCANYQQQLKARGYETATGVSQHELGRAVDIFPVSNSTFDKLLTLCEDKFKAIGVGSNWLHVDMRADQVRKWSYKR